MNGVDLLLPRQIHVVRSREEPDQTAGVRVPDSESERERLAVDLYVVVADQDGDGANGGPGEDSGVEAARSLPDEGNGGATEGGECEILG